MITHRITQTWGAGVDLIGRGVDVTGQTEANVSATIADGAANSPIDMEFTSTKLKSIYILVDKDCTLYTNNPSGSSPQDTIALKAGAPFVYIKDRMPYPFTGAVTAAYITIPHTTPTVDCDLEIRSLVDL